MRRRKLLGLAASTGVVGVLGVTATAADQPSDPPATRAEEPVVPVGERDSPIVATDTTMAGSETYGTVRQDASVLDLKSTDRYALVTKFRLIPGSNYKASTEWKTTSLTVEHVWLSGSLVSHSGDVVPADDGDADSNLYVGTDRSTGRYRWHMTFDTPTGDSYTVRFGTVVERNEPPEQGDALVDARFGAGFTKGFLRATERDFSTARLVLRGTAE